MLTSFRKEINKYTNRNRKMCEDKGGCNVENNGNKKNQRENVRENKTKK